MCCWFFFRKSVDAELFMLGALYRWHVLARSEGTAQHGLRAMYDGLLAFVRKYRMLASFVLTKHRRN